MTNLNDAMSLKRQGGQVNLAATAAASADANARVLPRQAVYRGPAKVAGANTEIKLQPRGYAGFKGMPDTPFTRPASAGQPKTQPVAKVNIKPLVAKPNTGRSLDGFYSQPMATKFAEPVRSQLPVQSVKPPVQAQVQTASQPRQLTAEERQAILRRAALLRARAKQQAEAQAMADAKAQFMAKAFEPIATVSTVSKFQPAMAVAGVAADTPVSQMISPATTAEMGLSASATGANYAGDNDDASVVQKLTGSKVTFAFKFNKERVLTVLRYIAVVIIIATSAYLAYDTYVTNRSVENGFNGGNSASAMSIAGANPATADQTAISQEAKAAYTVPADQPRFINIPTIGINARVMSVGVNSKGNIDTPTNLNDTAWYDGSAKPDQEGQVFIDGHTSFSNTINAAFNNLGKLKAGDVVTIEKGNGEKINYRVTEVKTVDADAVDMGEALNPPASAKKGLTLMTCTGTFNYRTQTADKRLIVYAVQE
ncbi:MAG: class F sortase [Candidatus Saccharibacteria bacterium]|nr:class F sortase [Candidatus Saccharibacteria bacterium]